MNRLQAAMKESAPRRQAYMLQKVGYKIGSFFKGCAFCGDTEERQAGERMRTFYLSGYNVWRAYVPRRVNWTYWCYDCGARDSQAWNNAKDLGLDAIRGTRDAVRLAKKAFRGHGRLTVTPTNPLENELAEVRAMLEAMLKMRKEN